MKLMKNTGAAVVEFAVILPLLLLLLFGIIEFGFLLYNKAMVTNASREGARAGIVINPRLSEAQIRNVVNSYCSNYLITFGNKVNGCNPKISIQKVDDEGNYGALISYSPNQLTPAVDLVVVEASFDYTWLVFGNLIKLFGAPNALSDKTLYAKTVMRAE